MSATKRLRKKIVLVDDHAIVRAGLARLINESDDLAACGEADSEGTALELVRRLRPDVAVIDWSLGHRDAARLVETLRAEYPAMPVLTLSIHEEVFYAERALRAGASGYVMKQEAADKIIEAIRCVAAGKLYLSERAARAVHRAGTAANELGNNEAPGPAEEDGGPLQAVSIVIPVYNSQATIGNLVRRLVAELERFYRLQIVLVDDGSTDNSAALCQQIQEAFPECVDFVALSRNFGEHNAVMAGLNCVEGAYAVIMDDDFQNPPSEVRALIEEIRKGRDVVYVRYESKQHSWHRNAGSRFHNWMATRVLGKPADLYLSSFKAMSRFLVREVIHYTGPDPYLDAIILRTTRKIGVISSRHEARRDGKSGYTFKKLVSLWGNMVVAFSLYPIRLLGAYGLVLTLVGMVYGAYTLIAYFSPLLADPDSLQQLSAGMWFFRGIHLLAVAIVGEYAGRIYRQLNRDPQYIIRNVLRRSVLQ